MSFLQADTLTLSSFIGFIHQYHSLTENKFKTKPLLLAFSPAQAVFDVFLPDETFLMSTDQGRIFSQEAELKWRRIEDNMHVAYLGNVSPPKGLQDYSSELAELKIEYTEAILWGKKTDKKNEWIEQQVPHRFNYPIPTAEYSRGRAVIVIENWLDEFGFSPFSRYHSIKEMQGEQHA